MCGPGDKMRIVWTFQIFVYFSAKTNPETEVLGCEKTETAFKIPQPPNTSYLHSVYRVSLASIISTTDEMLFEEELLNVNEI